MLSTPFVEPDPVKGVLGPSLAEKRPKTDTKIYILVSQYTSYSVRQAVWWPAPSPASQGHRRQTLRVTEAASKMDPQVTTVFEKNRSTNIDFQSGSIRPSRPEGTLAGWILGLAKYI